MRSIIPTVFHPSMTAETAARGLKPSEVMQFFDDFDKGYDTTFRWAVVEDAGAAVGDVITDANGGVLNVGPDGDDNDEVYVSSITESWQFLSGKRLTFEARVKVTEANVDDANIIIGLSDTVAANSLLDDGAGPMAAYDGAVFFKVDGGTVWQFEASENADQDTEASIGALTSATWTLLRFEFDGVATITPYIDDVECTAVTFPDLANAGAMHILMGAKAGGTGAEESLLVDYIGVWAER